MFETLSEKLQRVFKNLRGEGRLSELHIEEALKEIRIALLEADVNFKVVKQFTDTVKSKAARSGSVAEPESRPAGREDCSR